MVPSQVTWVPEAGAYMYLGMRIVENKWLTPQLERKQFRFPKSKKKRIRAKWAKRRENWKTIEKDVFYVKDNTIFLSSKNYKQVIDHEQIRST